MKAAYPPTLTPTGGHTAPARPHPLPQVQIKQHNLILLSTNKDEQNKPRHLEDIIAYLASIAVCYRH